MTPQLLRHPAVTVALVLAIGTAAMWPSLASLLHYWYTIPDYQHALLLVPIVVAWIALVARRADVQPREPSRGGTLALVAVLLAWLVTERASLDIAHQLLWPLALGCGLWSAGGWRFAVSFVPALGLVYGVIPVWDYLLPVLQRLSIFFSEHLLAMLGVQATVTENRVTIPEGTFIIIEGCSGKRYLIVAVAIAWLAAAVNHVPARRWPMLFATSVLLALLINWLRIVTVIYAGHVTHMQHYLVAVEHLTLGKVLFLPLLLGILLTARAFAGAEKTRLEARVDAGVAGRASGLLATIAAFAVIGLIVLAGPAVASTTRLKEAPLGAGGWEGPLPAGSGWLPEFTGADDQRRLRYQGAEAGQVELYVNLYATQRSGKEMVQYSNSLAAPAGWVRPWSQTGQALRTRGSRELRSFELQGADDRRWVVAYAYSVAGTLHLSDTTAKLAFGGRSLVGAAPAGVVAMASPCNGTNCDKARTLVADFWDNMSFPILSMLPD